MTNPGEVATTFLFEVVAQLEPRLDFGNGPLGRRMFDRVRSGTFDGPRLRGEILPGSGDPLLRRADGVFVIDARAILRTDDGALILMTYVGRVALPEDANADIVDPSRYAIRTAPVFETSAPAYRWLNGVVAIGLGYVGANTVGYRVSQVL